MQKREKLYWTPCAAHCIDLIFEDFEKNFKVHQLTILGRRVEHVVLDSRFWKNVSTCLKVVAPVMVVLRLVNSCKTRNGFHS